MRRWKELETYYLRMSDGTSSEPSPEVGLSERKEHWTVVGERCVVICCQQTRNPEQIT